MKKIFNPILNSSVRYQKEEFVFCIAHQEIVKLERGSCVGHTYTIQTDSWYGAEIEMCCLELGYAFCPPPISLFSDTDRLKTDEWKKWCEDNQPDYDELLISDLQAISLLDELEQK